MDTISLEQLRTKGMRFVIALAFANLLAIGAFSIFTGQWAGLVLAVLLSLAPVVMSAISKDNVLPRLMMGAVFPVYAAIACALAAGTSWQIDMHMLFFGYLAVLAILADWRVIAIGAAVTAIHHLLLNSLVPELVFAGGSNFARVAFHALVVIIATGALATLCVQISSLVNGQIKAQEKQAAIEAESRREQQERFDQQERTIADFNAALGELAKGNFVHRIEVNANDNDAHRKLSAVFNEAAENLSQTVGNVRSSALSVSTGSNEIRAASDDLAVRNEHQAASLEEAAASMSQVTELVKKTASSAKEAQGFMLEAHRQAQDGGNVVEKAVGAMASIEKSATEITQIIDVIDGIAFQTNLLALNAGVEAARAGDAGKGFAVVANEVRALAQRSAEAAQDIKQLISTSTAQVSDGVTLVGETGSLLDAIVEQIGSITAQVSDIAEMAGTQATNLDQVNSSVGAMDRMTQQNAAMVEQTTAAARNLASEASRLEGLVGQFRTHASPEEQLALPPIDEVGKPAPEARDPILERSAVPAISGNLALAHEETLVEDDQDWSEF